MIQGMGDSTLGLGDGSRGASMIGLLADIQQTLQSPIECSGVGLHTGVLAHVRILPLPAGSGRKFCRVDRPERTQIPATLQQVRSTQLSTELAVGEVSVRTVEHLLSALVATGVDNALIEIDGPEVPLLDGSAQIWVDAINAVGTVTQESPKQHAILTEPVWARHEEAFVVALPASELRFTYGIDFDLPAIGNQWQSWSPSQSQEPFDRMIAPARTFGLADQLEALRAQGLIQGGSLDNALVCGSDGWLNPPLRFENEPVRHKLLDLIGDLSLLGVIPKAHFLAYKASHQLHLKLAQALQNALF
jgi:UDP-3-O-[3-hydroxymyristoyl] N-acetylglucosamine deacetylase